MNWLKRFWRHVFGHVETDIKIYREVIYFCARCNKPLRVWDLETGRWRQYEKDK